jgi:hypothetical protein
MNKMKTLQEVLIEAFETDDGYKGDYHDKRAISLYEATLDDQAKKTIDAIFIDLCGYSFKSLTKLKDGTYEY